jgi:hypothetical protein
MSKGLHNFIFILFENKLKKVLGHVLSPMSKTMTSYEITPNNKITQHYISSL